VLGLFLWRRRKRNAPYQHTDYTAPEGPQEVAHAPDTVKYGMHQNPNVTHELQHEGVVKHEMPTDNVPPHKAAPPSELPASPVN
jgi:hypothetical protein